MGKQRVLELCLSQACSAVPFACQGPLRSLEQHSCPLVAGGVFRNLEGVCVSQDTCVVCGLSHLCVAGRVS